MQKKSALFPSSISALSLFFFFCRRHCRHLFFVVLCFRWVFFFLCCATACPWAPKHKIDPNHGRGRGRDYKRRSVGGGGLEARGEKKRECHGLCKKKEQGRGGASRQSGGTASESGGTGAQEATAREREREDERAPRMRRSRLRGRAATQKRVRAGKKSSRSPLFVLLSLLATDLCPSRRAAPSLGEKTSFVPRPLAIKKKGVGRRENRGVEEKKKEKKKA